MRVLIVENNVATNQDRLTLLQSNGFVTEVADSEDETVNLLRHYPFDLILLPAKLAGSPISKLLRRIRAAGFEVPALVFADKSAERQEALSAGADDAVADTTEPEECLGRIRAIIRRTCGYSRSVMSHGSLSLCLEVGFVTVAGREVHLTGKEFAILQLLLLRKNIVLSKEAILTSVYGGLDEPEAKIIDVFICKIRRKLADAGLPNVIQTVWGRGYTIAGSGHAPLTVPPPMPKLATDPELLTA